MALRRFGIERVANSVQLAERCKNTLPLLLAFLLFLATLRPFLIGKRSVFLLSFLLTSFLPVAIAIATPESATAPQSSELTTDLVKFLLLADGGNGIDVHVLDIAGPQPLAAEIGHQRIGTAVVQHPLNLGGQILT